jgi:transposase
LSNFSGYLSADEVYDGPFCVLFAVDSNQQRRLAYEVLGHSPPQEDIERFLRRVARMLTARGLTVAGITTDGSPLYPDSIKNVWPNAKHQVCEFHVIKEITKDVLRVVSRLRKALDAKIPKLPRGRPSTPQHKAQARLAKRMREQIGELFERRYLLVQHGLSPAEERILRQLARRHREIGQLRELMDAVYRLFDRRCRTEKALAKLAVLRGKLSRFAHLGKVLSKIQSPNIENALTFLDDKML